VRLAVKGEKDRRIVAKSRPLLPQGLLENEKFGA
jgi:hypothetical protein